MKKSMILCGHDTFREIFSRGQRVYGTILRCSYQVRPQSDPVLLAGFSVSKRGLSAVRRNRLRRLMKEAFVGEADQLLSALDRSEKKLRLVFSFVGSKEIPVARLGLQIIQDEVRNLLQALIPKL